MPEPPYGIIWDNLKAGNVIPFLGAGASFVGRLPDPNVKWTGIESPFLPSGVELAHFLANKSTFPSQDSRDRDDLAKVSSYYEDISDRSDLRNDLRDVFNRDYRPGPVHEFLAAVPAPLVTVVTNYDTLVEQAFRAVGKPYDLVVYPADRKDIANAILWWRHNEQTPVVSVPNELDIDLSKTTVIYKMHGTVRDLKEWDNFVITEEDYVEFLSRMTSNAAIPTLLYEHFRRRRFLFLGYSLRDWNLRVVLKNLEKYFATSGGLPTSWSIQVNPSELEQELWRRRKVSIFNQTLDEFVDNMRQWIGR